MDHLSFEQLKEELYKVAISNDYYYNRLTINEVYQQFLIDMDTRTITSKQDIVNAMIETIEKK